jgi:hypothetical protein
MPTREGPSQAYRRKTIRIAALSDLQQYLTGKNKPSLKKAL